MIKKIVACSIIFSCVCSTLYANPSGVVSETVSAAAMTDLQKQAISAFKAGQFTKAIELYHNLSGMQPNDAEILKDLMWSYWNAKKINETIETGKKILRLKPNDVETESLLGKAYQSTGNQAKALDAFEKVVGARPENISARFSLIRAQINAGRLSQAEALMYELEKEIPNNPSLRQKLADLWKGLARSYSDEGNQRKAILIYQRVLGMSRNYPQVQLALARLQVDQKNYDQAEQTLIQLIREAPDFKPAYPKLATVYFLKRNFQKSADTWKNAVALYPDKSEYKFKFAQALYYNGDHEIAVKKLDELLPDPRVGRRALDFLFDDFISRDEYAAAAKLMEDNLPYFDYEISDQRRLIRWSSVYQKMGEYEKSLRVVNQALEYYAGDGEAIAVKATVLLESGQVRKAINLMEELLEANPGTMNLLPILIDAYDKLGDLRSMLKTILLYRELDPTNPYVLLRQASVLQAMNKRETAKNLMVNWLKKNEKEGFIPILLYHGLTPHDRDEMLAYSQHHSIEAFEDQIRTLSESGFTAVTVADVDNWYNSQIPLPDKPILITFDDGRLDSFRYADPILKKYGMKATMFVICQNTERNLPNYANWKELRQYKNTGRWELQAHTDHGHSYIQITKEGYQGLFLINKKYLPGEKRLESRREWVNRINEDHARSKRKLKEELNIDPIGFAFPQGNFWQANIPNAKTSTDINLTAVRNYYNVAFFQDSNGINAYSRDPYLLNRFEPPQGWTGDDLLLHISDENPAARMRATLLRWAVWQSRIDEAYYWLRQLKAGGASDYLLASEQARIQASRGNMVLAKNLQKDAESSLGRASSHSNELNPVRSEQSPRYKAEALYFDDSDDRENWGFIHGIHSGRLGQFKFRALQRIGQYNEINVPEVSENSLGLGVDMALNLRHSIDTEGFFHSFNADADDQLSGKLDFSSLWRDELRTRFGIAREPLFYGKALNADIHLKSANVEAVFEPAERWDVTVAGQGADYSDGNNRWVGQAAVSWGITEAQTPRLMYRFSAISNQDPSPFYYSPLSLVENNLGLTHTFEINRPIKLLLTYLPGIGKESGHGTRFVQNFRTELAFRWASATSLKLGFNYGQTPTYHSRGGNIAFEHRFNGSSSESTPKGRIATPEAPQPDLRDANPF